MNPPSEADCPTAVDALALPDESLRPERPAHVAQRPVGRVNTPAPVARWMANEAVKAVAEAAELRSSTIVEPAAGSGVIIAALVEALSRRGGPFQHDRSQALHRIWAIDADADVRRLARRRLHLALGRSPDAWLRKRYRVGDTLADPALLPRRPIDLIIGNPPYLGIRHARRLPAFQQWQARLGVREDLYAYFIRWAIQAVRPGGHVVLLVPDSWLSLATYEGLRERLLKGRLRLLVRLPEDTFDRHVFPCFFVWQKAAAHSTRVRYVDARRTRLPAMANARPVCKAPQFAVRQSLFRRSPGNNIFVPTPQTRRVAALWQALSAHPESSVAPAASAKLQEIARIADVGIHSRNCRHRLFHARRTKPGLQRLLQGRQIDRYAVRWDSPKAQYRWVDIGYVPRPNVLGRRGNGRPSVRDEYWGWQGDPAIHRLPERILIRQTGDRIVAARCVQRGVPHYTDNTLFTATLTDAARAAGITCTYLLAYLNSEIVTRLYRFLSGEEGRAQAQIKIRLLRRLPFIRPKPRSIRRIDALVTEIETAVADGAAPSAQRKAIDRHFARLFADAANSILPSRAGSRDPDG